MSDAVDSSTLTPRYNATAARMRAGVPALTAFTQRVAELVLMVALLYSLGTLTPDFTPVDEETLTTVRSHAPLMAQASPINQIVWLSLMAIAGAMLLSAPRRFVMFLPLAAPMLVLCVYILVSSTWALVPEISLRRGILFTIVALVFGFAVLYAKNPKRVFTIVYLSFLVALTANLLAIPLPSSYHLGGAFGPGEGLFRGIQPHKNQLGGICTMALFVGAAAWRAKAPLLEKLVWFYYMGAAVLILIMTGSKTALGLVIMVPVVLLIMNGLRTVIPFSRVVMMFYGLIGALMIGLFVVLGMGISVQEILNATMEDPTFTGRTFLWDFTSEQIATRPLFGFGFQSFWGIGFESPAARAPLPFARVVNQAHNGYLDVIVNLGFIGSTLFILVIGAFLASLRRVSSYSQRYSFMIWSIFFFFLFSNITETSFLRQDTQEWVLFLVLLYWTHSIRMHLDQDQAAAAARPAHRGG